MIQCEEPAVPGGGIDLPFVEGDSTVVHPAHLSPALDRLADLGVIGPEQIARHRVNGPYDVHGAREIHDPIHH